MRPLLSSARRALLCGLAAALPAIAAGEAARPMLRIGAIAEAPSAVDTIGERVVREACERAGIGLTVMPLPMMRSIAMADRGDTDGEMVRIAEVVELYPSLMLVPTPVSRVDVVVYGRAGELRGLSRDGVSRLSFAYPRGLFVLNKLSRGLRAIDVASIDRAFDMVATHRVDAVLVPYPDGEEALQRLRLQGVERWPAVWGSEPLYLLLNRRWASVLPRLDAALQQMARDGSIERHHREGLRAHGVAPLPP